MPTLVEWVEPELAFRLRDGRPVFHCYKDDKVGGETPTLMQYHYTLSPDPDDEDSGEYVVDFRDWMSRMPWGEGHPQFPSKEDYVDEIAVAMCVLQRAVDEGLIWPRGEPRAD